MYDTNFKIEKNKKYLYLILENKDLRKILISKYTKMKNYSMVKTKNKITNLAYSYMYKSIKDNQSLKKKIYKNINIDSGSKINRIIHNNIKNYEVIEINPVFNVYENIRVIINNTYKSLKGKKFKNIYGMDLYICKGYNYEFELYNYYLVDKNKSKVIFEGDTKKRVIKNFDMFIKEKKEKQIKNFIENYLLNK